MNYRISTYEIEKSLKLFLDNPMYHISQWLYNYDSIVDVRYLEDRQKVRTAIDKTNFEKTFKACRTVRRVGYYLQYTDIDQTMITLVREDLATSFFRNETNHPYPFALYKKLMYQLGGNSMFVTLDRDITTRALPMLYKKLDVESFQNLRSAWYMEDFYPFSVVPIGVKRHWLGIYEPASSFQGYDYSEFEPPSLYNRLYQEFYRCVTLDYYKYCIRSYGPDFFKNWKDGFLVHPLDLVK